MTIFKFLDIPMNGAKLNIHEGNLCLLHEGVVYATPILHDNTVSFDMDNWHLGDNSVISEKEDT